MNTDFQEEWADEKVVGNGGSSGILYVPKKYAGYDAKLIIPNNGSEDVITKTIGEGLYSGYLYVHKKHLGKTVKIMILPRKTPQEAD
ncbi:MAG: DUF2080 family transposase-associated protein [Flavobacteriaceae bacterium]|nr:DUF2080 family transposase-associated protein [Flavobacteriaceae bacterium]